MTNNSIRLIDKTSSGPTNPGPGGPGNNGYERVLHIPQTLALLEHHNMIDYCLIQDTHKWGLPLWREAVGVFQSPSQQNGF